MFDKEKEEIKELKKRLREIKAELSLLVDDSGDLMYELESIENLYSELQKNVEKVKEKLSAF